MNGTVAAADALTELARSWEDDARTHQRYDPADPKARVLARCAEDLRRTQLMELAGVERFDVIMGGPPCQGLSRANAKACIGAIENQINEQVGGGDLASLAERLESIDIWQQGAMERLEAIEEREGMDRLVANELRARVRRLERRVYELPVGTELAAPGSGRVLDEPEPPQAPAERRTGEKLADMVRPGWRERKAALGGDAYFCPQCGPGVVVDEDECCAGCGATCCTVSKAREMLAPPPPTDTQKASVGEVEAKWAALSDGEFAAEVRRGIAFQPGLGSTKLAGVGMAHIIVPPEGRAECQGDGAVLTAPTSDEPTDSRASVTANPETGSREGGSARVAPPSAAGAGEDYYHDGVSTEVLEAWGGTDRVEVTIRVDATGADANAAYGRLVPGNMLTGTRGTPVRVTVLAPPATEAREG